MNLYTAHTCTYKHMIIFNMRNHYASVSDSAQEYPPTVQQCPSPRAVCRVNSMSWSTRRFTMPSPLPVRELTPASGVSRHCSTQARNACSWTSLPRSLELGLERCLPGSSG